MVKKKRLWVYLGEVPEAFDIVEAIRNDREERMRRLAGCESGGAGNPVGDRLDNV